MAPAEMSNRRVREIIGVAAILGSLFMGLSLTTYDRWDNALFTYSPAPAKNYGGPLGAYVADVVFSLIGLSGYILPVFLLIYGVRRIIGSERSHAHVIGLVILVPALSMLFTLLSPVLASPVSSPGGVFGYLLSELSVSVVSKAGSYILAFALILAGVILLSPVSIFSFIVDRKRAPKKAERNVAPARESEIVIAGETAFGTEDSGEADEGESPRSERPRRSGDYRFPPLDLLKEALGVPGPTREELTNLAASLEKKLLDFGVNGKVKQAHPGPVVTMYEFEPAAGVKIHRIVSLSDDLALALRAPSIRIYPIPGKATIGIEVPNRNRATVSLREVISSDIYQKSASLLTLTLGKDIFGAPVVTDLGKMPHLLVAGATGSGKSISMNVMIMSILYKASPDDVKMLLIDPKLLELSAYADIPHLVSPVITSPKEASEALKKVVLEMERRYRVLAERGTRNIETFNRQVSLAERLPYIVVFIDELADLMFTAPSDVENAIARLAQMARASGIHLILATQRPSVDVITGLIKANFPARISFQVTSKIDSRTILDAQGAEQLLGMGDMLFMVPGVRTMRIHGAYVSESEVRDVTEFVKSQGSPDYTQFDSIVLVDEKDQGLEVSSERDEGYQRVIEFGRSAGELSISSIQRRFKVGYNKAARYMELLEEDGLVGPPKGAGKPRDFLGKR